MEAVRFLIMRDSTCWRPWINFKESMLLFDSEILGLQTPKNQICQYKIWLIFKVPRNGIQTLTTTCPSGSKWWCFHEFDWDSRYPSTISYIRKYAHIHKYCQISHPWACSRKTIGGVENIWTSFYFQVAMLMSQYNYKKDPTKGYFKKRHPISDPYSDRPSEGWNKWPSFKFHLGDAEVSTSEIQGFAINILCIPTVYRYTPETSLKSRSGCFPSCFKMFKPSYHPPKNPPKSGNKRPIETAKRRKQRSDPTEKM